MDVFHVSSLSWEIFFFFLSFLRRSFCPRWRIKDPCYYFFLAKSIGDPKVIKSYSIRIWLVRFFFFPRFLIEFVEFKGKRFKDPCCVFHEKYTFGFLPRTKYQFPRDRNRSISPFVSFHLSTNRFYFFFFSYCTSMNPIVFLERKRERERQREKMIR